MISMPPRHGKSELVSRYFPAWYLGAYPDRKVILASYEADFAMTWGRKARDIMEQYGKSIFSVEVDKRSSAADHWTLRGREGGMDTAGAGGPITGKGANLFIVDDPIKGAEDANSLTLREKAWDWWRAVIHTRLQPDASIVVIQTRWHEDDLSGRILRESKEKWKKIILPAFAEEKDPLGRKEGDPLWPEQWSTVALEAKREELGSYWWSALYQQRPAPIEGALFKREWFKYFTDEGDVYLLDGRAFRAAQCNVFMTVDTAATAKERSDWTVFMTWAQTADRDLLLLNVERRQIEGPEALTLARNLYTRYKPGFIGVEKSAISINLIQSLKRAGLPIKDIEPKGDKYGRALSARARMESGSVYFKHKAKWIDVLEDELLAFNTGRYDDQVDALVYGVQCMLDYGVGTLPPVELGSEEAVFTEWEKVW